MSHANARLTAAGRCDAAAVGHGQAAHRPAAWVSGQSVSARRVKGSATTARLPRSPHRTSPARAERTMTRPGVNGQEEVAGGLAQGLEAVQASRVTTVSSQRVRVIPVSARS